MIRYLGMCIIMYGLGFAAALVKYNPEDMKVTLFAFIIGLVLMVSGEVLDHNKRQSE